MKNSALHTNGYTRLAMAVVLSCGIAFAQENGSTQDDKTPYRIQTSANLVVLDVTVAGGDGKPVHGLTAKDFLVKEDGQAQTVRGFHEHEAGVIHASAPAPKLAAGLFTNFTQAGVGGPSNVLLLDMLNTPLRDQAYARDQIRQYLDHAPAGTQIAIFGLSNSLVMLQGFSADPTILKAALANKNSTRASSLLNDPLGGGGGDGAGESGISDALSQLGNSPDVQEAVANAQQFEAETQSFQMQYRAQLTLDALNQLARFLVAIPGRKNVIWFSGSFPASILPNTDINNGFAAMSSVDAEFRETMDLLARNQISLYPVDARGLITSGTFNAASSSSKYATDPQALGKDLTKFNAQMEQTNQTMLQAAQSTGGEAFINTNGLREAVGKAIENGSNYYTITYSPTNKNYDGKYRKIEVAVAEKNLELSYRKGYFADDPAALDVREGVERTPATTSAITRSMARGAPFSTQIEFTVRVLPAKQEMESALAEGSLPSTENPASKGPYQRFAVDFAINPAGFIFQKYPRGFQDSIRFVAFVYDAYGEIIMRSGSKMQANLTAEIYADFLRHPLSYNLDVSVPTKGTYFLRLGIEDENSHNTGSVEVPLDSVRGLPALTGIVAPK